MKKVKKAVFPVAGLGTRFLPATKATPKEMLPIVDKPLIQYAAEEAVAAGIEVLIFITGRNKRPIEDHFDKAVELEVELQDSGKTQLLDIVREILPAQVDCVYIRQQEALGLGHAVLCARPVIGDEPFAVILADDLIKTEKNSCLSQMIEVYNEQVKSVLGVERVPFESVDKYGIVDNMPIEGRLSKINSIIEKPEVGAAPSNLAVVGRYILTPGIFGHLERTGKGTGGEIQLTDALAKLLEDETILAYEFNGKRFDCGNKLGYLKATVEYALQHPDLKAGFRSYLDKTVF